jgi:NAD(P)H-dependent FMN reductase
MTMSSLKLSVIIGSTRPNRFSEKPAQWIYEEAKKLEGVEVELLDLRDYPLPFYDEPMSPSMVKDGNYEKPEVRKWAEKIKASDGFIIVTPEYNHGYPAVLKNALDYVYYEWNNKAVGFVTYGSVGGARAVEQLRQVAVELQMASVRASVHIPGSIQFPIMAGEAEWKPLEDASLMKAAGGMLKQLVWWTRALKNAREQNA